MVTLGMNHEGVWHSLAASDGPKRCDRGLAEVQAAGDGEETRARDGEDSAPQETLPHLQDRGK